MNLNKQQCHFCHEFTISDLEFNCLPCASLFSLYKVITYTFNKAAYIYPLDDAARFYFVHNTIYFGNYGSATIVVNNITPANALSKLKFYLSFQ